MTYCIKHEPNFKGLHHGLFGTDACKDRVCCNCCEKNHRVWRLHLPLRGAPAEGSLYGPCSVMGNISLHTTQRGEIAPVCGAWKYFRTVSPLPSSYLMQFTAALFVYVCFWWDSQCRLICLVSSARRQQRKSCKPIQRRSSLARSLISMCKHFKLFKLIDWFKL